jgi:hypothetical protein
MSVRERLHRSITALIDAPPDSVSPAVVEQLALEVFHWQRARNPAYARIAEAALDGADPATIDEIPAVPTDVFKHARVACFEPERDLRTFLTSGTTQERRGAHPFDDLSLYARAAVVAARRWLLPAPRYRLVLLCADEREAPESSLSFMLARFAERWGGGDFCVAGGRLDHALALARIEGARREGVPVALLGASYGFVHLVDAMGDARVELPAGSVVMPTGGFKGRSREVEPDAFHALLGARLGVTRAQIVGEYGMTELSSQAYEAHAEGAPPGTYRAPPWMSVSAVDPATLAPLPKGKVGLVRVVDLANLGSAVAIQTSDLGRVTDAGFEVLGRAPGAAPRGCARALDAALAGGLSGG